MKTVFKQIKKMFWRVQAVFGILRAMFIIWFLRRYTQPEFIPLTTYGTFEAFKGDIAVIQGLDGSTELGEITAVEAREAILPTVTIRLFRRPNAKANK